MTNIEAMTIGAKARLQHLLNIDVTRHLREMSRPAKSKPLTFSQEAIDLLINPPVFLAGGGAVGPAISMTTGGGAGGACGFAYNQPSAHMLAVPSTMNAIPSRF